LKPFQELPEKVLNYPITKLPIYQMGEQQARKSLPDDFQSHGTRRAANAFDRGID
jgi:hypothetical protein